jgi:hypothetical protein
MSQKVTVKTVITNKEFAAVALKAAGLEFEEMGSTGLRIKSGALANATIDLTTGNLTGDTDYGHRKSTFEGVIRGYAEAKFRHEAGQSGVQIKARTIEKNGDVKLVCRMAHA